MGRGRGRRRGRGRGTGAGRRVGAGVPPAAPLPPAPATPPPQSGPITRQQELEALRAQAHAIEERLRAVHAHIDQIGKAPSRAAAAVAVVDPRACVACGLCQEVCPTGAITVDAIAQINGAKCTGCGRCVAECPRHALSLQEV